jgi:hypothetical protein
MRRLEMAASSVLSGGGTTENTFLQTSPSDSTMLMICGVATSLTSLPGAEQRCGWKGSQKIR